MHMEAVSQSVNLNHTASGSLHGSMSHTRNHGPVENSALGRHNWVQGASGVRNFGVHDNNGQIVGNWLEEVEHQAFANPAATYPVGNNSRVDNELANNAVLDSTFSTMDQLLSGTRPPTTP